MLKYGNVHNHREQDRQRSIKRKEKKKSEDMFKYKNEKRWKNKRKKSWKKQHLCQ